MEEQTRQTVSAQKKSAKRKTPKPLAKAIAQKSPESSAQKHCRMKDLPAYCRPYEKCERYGAEALSNAELLAVILQTGYYSGKEKVNKSALALAEELLCRNGGELGLLSLRHGTPETFQLVEGIGQAKAVRLACVAELAARLWQEQQLRRLDLKSPETVAAYYREELRHLNQERVCIMLMDGRDNFLMSHVISQGSINLSVLSPREIFYEALIHRAASFVLVHNHPSGDARPSKEDRRFTAALYALGRMMNVPLRDSLIIADAGYYSFLEAGELGSSRSVNGQYKDFKIPLGHSDGAVHCHDCAEFPEGQRDESGAQRRRLRFGSNSAGNQSHRYGDL